MVYTRLCLCNGLLEALDGEAQDDGADQEKAEHLRPKDIDTDPLEKDAAYDDQVVAKRIQEGQQLYRFGHVFDGKGKAREEHGRKDEEKGAHHRLLLGMADGGYEEAEAEGAHEKEGGGGKEKDQASPQRNLEPEVCDGRYHRHIDEADDYERDGLPEYELGLCYGGGDDLLHGADLFFPDNRHARQEHGDDQDDVGDDRRHVIIAALQVVVEPGAAFQFDPAQPDRLYPVFTLLLHQQEVVVSPRNS